MKSAIVLLVSSMSISAFASETKYICLAKHIARYRYDNTNVDSEDGVENLPVTVDASETNAIFPISKKHISIEIFTVKPEEDGLLGQYSLHVIVSKDKDSTSTKEAYEANTYFMGFDQEIGLALQIPAPGAKKSGFAVLCKLDQETSLDQDPSSP